MLKSNKILNNHENNQFGALNYHVLEGIADWVRVVDKRGVIIYANKAMKKDLGEEIVGKRCNEAHCDGKRCNFCITERSILTGETVQKEEMINEDYYSIKSSPVRNEDGEIFAAVEVFRDVTRERILEKELIKQNRKMREDVRFAKKIQEQILPKRGNYLDMKLEYIYRPSEMLSGDMFDFFRIDDENVGIYISDVAGNGVSASMMTMFVRQTMRVMKEEFKKPSDSLKELHRRFVDLDLEAENYFTIFYGIYNTKSKIFKYSNAGHNCIPIKFNGNNIELLENKGFPITSIIEDGIDYAEKEIKLEKGDKLLFYTDGVTEARNSIGYEFGLEGVLEILKEDPDNLLESIETEILNYSWIDQLDDIALVLLEI